MDLNIPSEFNGCNIIGDVTNPYHQTYSDTCAIKSQQLILNEFGVMVSEDQLVEYSVEHGWYNGNGTQMQDVGNILIDAGIPCTRTYDANIYDLMNELSQGHKVIVAVDSGELWENSISDFLKDIFVGDTPDHALIVAGIDISDPDNPMVILTDPGTGQAAQPYPLDQFMDAWGDSSNYMVSTDIPTPQMVNDFTNCGFDQMHLPEVAGVDFNIFQTFVDYSHLIPQFQIPDLTSAFLSVPAMTDFNFYTAIEPYSLPYFDINTFTPFEFQPISFDYDAFAYNSAFSDPFPLDFSEDFTSESRLSPHSVELLTDLHQDALNHYQQCLNEGMYISAQMWQNQANEIQDTLDNF